MNKNRQSNHIKSIISRKNKRDKSLEVEQNSIDKKANVRPRKSKRNSQEGFAVEERVEKPTKPNRESKLDKVFSKIGIDIYKVETPVYSRLLNELSRVARFKNIEHKDGILTFEASKKERAEIIALLDDLCYTHNIVASKGVLNSVISVLKRAGLVVGIFCAVGLFCLYPRFVFTVEYNGDRDQKVLDVLSQYGVQQGAFIYNLDEKAVEKSLLSLEGVSFASVEKVGTRVCVRVEHELAPDSYVGSTGSTVASKDGKVTRVVVYSGTAEVAVGDTVSVGQTLIGDYYINGEDKIPAFASGEVYVERQVEFDRFFPDEYFTATGQAEKVTVIGLFRESKTPKSPYQYYTVKRAVSKNDFLLPFVVTQWVFYEIKLTQNSMSEDEMKEVAYGEVIDNNRFERVISRTVTIERVDGGYNVKVILTVEEKQ